MEASPVGVATMGEAGTAPPLLRFLGTHLRSSRTHLLHGFPREQLDLAIKQPSQAKDSFP